MEPINRDLSEELRYGTHTQEFRSAGGIIISPSGITKSMENPGLWYLDATGTNPNPFSGNSNTVLGTLVHEKVQRYYQNEPQTSLESILEYLDHQSRFIPEIALEMDSIAQEAEDMFQAFLSSDDKPKKLTSVEENIYMEPKDGMMFGGTLDGFFGKTVVDWKTTKQLKSNIGDYVWQLACYVILKRAMGVEVTQWAIGYFVRRTKTIPTRFVFVQEPVNENIVKTLEMHLLSLSSRLLLSKKDSSLTPLLFPHSYVGMFGSPIVDFIAKEVGENNELKGW